MAAYGRIERGERTPRGESNSTWTTLQRIARTLDVSMGELAALSDTE